MKDQTFICNLKAKQNVLMVSGKSNCQKSSDTSQILKMDIIVKTRSSWASFKIQTKKSQLTEILHEFSKKIIFLKEVTYKNVKLYSWHSGKKIFSQNFFGKGQIDFKLLPKKSSIL